MCTSREDHSLLNNWCRDIDAGININCTDKNGRTPLMLCAIGGHAKCIELLLKEVTHDLIALLYTPSVLHLTCTNDFE